MGTQAMCLSVFCLKYLIQTARTRQVRLQNTSETEVRKTVWFFYLLVTVNTKNLYCRFFYCFET